MSADVDGAAVAVQDLVKRYPKAPVNAVDTVSLSVRPGEVYGLLGPNGAGKTTTVGVLTTRVRPTGGRASIAGIDVCRHPVHARRLLGVVPQRNNLDRSLSIRHNLLFHAAYHGVARGEARRRAEALLDEFGLAERAGDKPDFISGGQAQRIMIARSLMHSPVALFLDEPTTGLDPAARLFVWDRVRDLSASGVTVLLTTHDMDEADALCERVGIMDHGRLLAESTPEALTRSLPGSQTLDVSVTTQGRQPEHFLTALEHLEGVEWVERVSESSELASENTLRARIHVAGDAPALVVPLARLVADLGLRLDNVGISRPSLEDVFISLTGRALR